MPLQERENENRMLYTYWPYNKLELTQITKKQKKRLKEQIEIKKKKFIILQLEELEPFSNFILFLDELTKKENEEVTDADNGKGFLSFSEILDLIFDEKGVKPKFLIFDYRKEIFTKLLSQALDTTLELGLIVPKWLKKKDLWHRCYGNRNEFTNSLIDNQFYQFSRYSPLSPLIRKCKENMESFYQGLSGNNIKQPDTTKDWDTSVSEEIELGYFLNFLEIIQTHFLDRYEINEHSKSSLAFIPLYRKADFLWEWLYKKKEEPIFRKYQKTIELLKERLISQAFFEYLDSSQLNFKFIIIFDEMIKHGHTVYNFLSESQEHFKETKILVVSLFLLNQKTSQNTLSKLQEKFQNIDFRPTKIVDNKKTFETMCNQIYNYISLKNEITDRDHYSLDLNFDNKVLSINEFLFRLKNLIQKDIIHDYYESGIWYYPTKVKKISLLLNQKSFQTKIAVKNISESIHEFEQFKVRLFIHYNINNELNEATINKLTILPVIIPVIKEIDHNSCNNKLDNNCNIPSIFGENCMIEKVKKGKKSEWCRECLFFQINCLISLEFYNQLNFHDIDPKKDPKFPRHVSHFSKIFQSA